MSDLDEFHPEMEDAAQDLSPEDEFTDWGGGELEAAYMKAMQALEASEAELPQVPTIELTQSDVAPIKPRTETMTSADSEPDRSVKMDQAKSALTDLMAESQPKPLLADHQIRPADVRINPRQILEACLFVGGMPLVSGKLASVLRIECDSDFIDREIDELNRLYAAENRPYEIRLGDGGYRLALREEFERIRYKVYGLGPKEVRLSQESLEVLAVVAYHQPIKQSGVQELGKPNCGTVLRQLVRRELLAVERDPEAPRDVFYKTTARFLSLFGIQNLDDLPRHEQVGYK